jgi:hypothetical protein
MIECKGKNLDDCNNCHNLNLWHAWFYSEIYKQKICQIKCRIGGVKNFNSDGELLKERY